jgi:hypothetical protein
MVSIAAPKGFGTSGAGLAEKGPALDLAKPAETACIRLVEKRLF